MDLEVFDDAEQDEIIKAKSQNFSSASISGMVLYGLMGALLIFFRIALPSVEGINFNLWPLTIDPWPWHKPSPTHTQTIFFIWPSLQSKEYWTKVRMIIGSVFKVFYFMSLYFYRINHFTPHAQDNNKPTMVNLPFCILLFHRCFMLW